MDYNKAFTDYEKMLREGMLQGFMNNNYARIYEYLYARKGIEYANTWMLQNKKDKRYFCAKLILDYIYDNEAICEKAKKYIDKYDKRRKA